VGRVAIPTLPRTFIGRRAFLISTTDDKNARSALECGSSSYRFFVASFPYEPTGGKAVAAATALQSAFGARFGAPPRRLALVELEILLPRGSFPMSDGPPALNSACAGLQGDASAEIMEPSKLEFLPIRPWAYRAILRPCQCGKVVHKCLVSQFSI
jgi:hypothetical protein